MPALRRPASRLTLILLVLLASLAVSGFSERPPAAIAAPPVESAAASCADGPQTSGAIYRICMPAHWNGDLLVYAHGFVAPQLPVGIPEDQLVLPDGSSLVDLTTNLGFAFAMSSYRKNGLAILEGVDDLKDVVSIFTNQHGAPKHVYLGGVSEGGLVATLSLERVSGVYDGGLAACGPVGDFPGQVNYLGDARILFDYYYPGVIPGSAASVPPEVIANWDDHYKGLIVDKLLANVSKLDELMRVAKIPRQSGGDRVNAETVAGLIWYNVHATADATTELGGQFYDNRFRLYVGSANDSRLNSTIQRFSADSAAVTTMRAYQTNGRPLAPLITIHTTGDPIVPYWHEALYKNKAPLHINTPILRSGHCNFTVGEALIAFLKLKLLTP